MGMAASKQEEFWEACGFGREHIVKKFIDEGVIDINWVSYTHNSCAIHVASQGKPNIVRMLIEAKCDVNVKDDWGNLPLHHAAMKGHADIIEMLLRGGSELHAPNKNGWTALINAAYWCQPDAIKALLDNKCDIHMENKDDRTALHEVCRSQSKDEEALAKITQMLIDAGADINKKTSCTNPSLIEADFSPVMFSAYHNHPLVTQTLINAKCNLNVQGSNGWSALHWAGSKGQTEIVGILLEGGIDPHLQGQRGELAVDRAHNKECKTLMSQAMGRTGDISSSNSTSPQGGASPTEGEKVVVTDAGRLKLQQLLLAQEKRNKPTVALEVKQAQAKEDGDNKSEVSTIYSTTDDESIHSVSRESSVTPGASPKHVPTSTSEDTSKTEDKQKSEPQDVEASKTVCSNATLETPSISITNADSTEKQTDVTENGVSESPSHEEKTAELAKDASDCSKPGDKSKEVTGSPPLAEDEFDESEIGDFDEGLVQN